MKNYLKLIILLLIPFAGCKDNEDPDTRNAFVGAYEAEDFDITLGSQNFSDTVISVESNPTIEFERDDDLDDDELQADVEEFIEDVVKSALGNIITAGIAIDVDDDMECEIDGKEIEIDDLDFKLLISESGETTSFPCELSAEGELDGQTLLLDFGIEIIAGPGESIFITGTVNFEKD